MIVSSDVPSAPTISTPLKHCGHSFSSWTRLLARNRFDLEWTLWPAVAVTTAICGLQSILGGVQNLLCGGAIDGTEVEAPIFVVGHWRTGTSLLHELLTLDPRIAHPTVYAALQPHHFLLTERWIQACLRNRPARRRAMDNMLVRLDSPVEDEFALMFLGQPTPYEVLAFPNRPTTASRYFDLADLPQAHRENWQRAMHRFVQQLTYQHRRRIVLKSPLHSARIPALLEIFPDACFVHIVRNPFDVVPSAVHTWKSLCNVFALQHPQYDDLEERVFENYQRLYRKLGRDKGLVPTDRFHELRYEDLTADPLGQMEGVYQTLRLGMAEFQQVRPKIEQYFTRRKNYHTNQYSLDPSQIREIERRCSDVIEAYGYDKRSSARIAASPTL